MNTPSAAPEGASKRSAKDVMKKASTKNLFRHFKNKTPILQEARDYLDSITGPEGDWFETEHWDPTNKYAFHHAYFPKEIMFKCPLCTFIYERFGQIQPWILGVGPGVQFEQHVDQSKGASLNIAIRPRGQVITTFRHSNYHRRFQQQIGGMEYCDEGGVVLLNNMKPHSVINWSSEPSFTFTIPCVLKRPDFDDLFVDGVYEYLANVKDDGTYRPGQDLNMPSNDSLTPQHLEIIIFNKVLKILVEEGGFEIDEHFRSGQRSKSSS